MKPPSKATLRKYGLTEEQHGKILARQGWTCGLCGHGFTGTPHIDHCHKTGRVRGICHAYCNRRRIGQHGFESAEMLYEYLLAPPAWGVLPSDHVVPKRKKRRR